MNYELFTWGSTFESYLDQLNVTCKWIIKIIMSKPKPSRYHNELLFEDSKLST